ncbi:hypothetical protein AB5N19_10689 [Seiridium cardinale]|uniref:FAD-binding domain-containing protein n=1 Tax=Seiridium cardinale TaxID=138064 RepID=A0ABR2XSL7_9PEZI
MTPANHSPHILIVGAGLGGLTLAQCLRKQGVSFEIFERDASEESRSQGWAIGLHTMLNELHDAVPAGMPNLREAVHHLAPLKLKTQICMYFNNQLDNRIGVQDTPETPCIRANRPRFRQWLSTDIPIQWSKRVTGIDETPDGRISLRFADGGMAVGDILVGADGVHSITREHLLQRPNDEVLNVVPTATIIGEIELSGQDMERQLSLGHSCWLATTPNFTHRLFVGLQQVSPDGRSGQYYWFFMQNDDKVGQPGHWLNTASREEKLAYVKKHTSSLDPKLREIVEATPVQGIKDMPFIYRDAELSNLPSGRVALLGDAVHPMTPFRGEGGVHAIRDALLLSKKLGEVNTQDTQSIVKAIDTYHAEVLERGVQAVRNSRGAHSSNTLTRPKHVGWGNTASPIPPEMVTLASAI